MIILTALLSSARRTLLRKRMIILYWFFYSLMASLIALPMMGVAVPALSHSTYAQSLLKAFDVAWLMEVTSSTQFDQQGIILPVMLVCALLKVGS